MRSEVRGLLVAITAAFSSFAPCAHAQGQMEAVATGPRDAVVLHVGSYVVPGTVEEAWSAWTDPAKRAIWFGSPGTEAQTSGNQGGPPYVQRIMTNHPLLPGPTESTVMMKQGEGNTIVVQTMLGLGGAELWRNSVDPGQGIAEMMGDLALYLKTGVGFPRHIKAALPPKRPHPNDFQAGARDFPGGVHIINVPAGTIGAQAGMQAGDILVAMNDAAIYSQRDIEVTTDHLAPGDLVELAWIRKGKVMRGSGKMTRTPVERRK